MWKCWQAKRDIYSTTKLLAFRGGQEMTPAIWGRWAWVVSGKLPAGQHGKWQGFLNSNWSLSIMLTRSRKGNKKRLNSGISLIRNWLKGVRSMPLYHLISVLRKQAGECEVQAMRVIVTDCIIQYLRAGVNPPSKCMPSRTRGGEKRDQWATTSIMATRYCFCSQGDGGLYRRRAVSWIWRWAWESRGWWGAEHWGWTTRQSRAS